MISRLVIDDEKIWYKDLEKLPQKIRESLYQDLDLLNQNPWPPQLKIKKLHHYPYADYRLRLGDYRLLFDIDNKTKEIVLLRIRHRSELY